MARTPKSANNIQVFRGSLPPADVFAQNAGADCCGGGTTVEHDKLGARTRFSNALAHSNPPLATRDERPERGLDEAGVARLVAEAGALTAEAR